MTELRIVAGAGYAVFLLLAFGYRTLVHLRRQGNTGWRSPVSRVDAVGESICVLGCALTLCAPILPGGGLVRGLAVVRAPIALCLIAVGTALALIAQREMGAQWRAGVEASPELVTTGVFRRVRNPFYVACMLASLGVLVATASPVAVLGFGAHVVAAVIIVVFVEEPLLAQRHGAAYAEYQRRSGRFLPRRYSG